MPCSSSLDFEDFDADKLGVFLSNRLGNKMLKGSFQKMDVNGKEILDFTFKKLHSKGLAQDVAKEIMANVKEFQGENFYFIIFIEKKK